MFGATSQFMFGVTAVQDKAHLSLEQQLKVIALRHNLLAQMDDILQDRKRMIATLQVTPACACHCQRCMYFAHVGLFPPQQVLWVSGAAGRGRQAHAESCIHSSHGVDVGMLSAANGLTLPATPDRDHLSMVRRCCYKASGETPSSRALAVQADAAAADKGSARVEALLAAGQVTAQLKASQAQEQQLVSAFLHHLCEQACYRPLNAQCSAQAFRPSSFW